MKSFKEFCIYHGDIATATDITSEEFKSLKGSLTIDEIIDNGSPALLIWVATSIGVAPPETMRLFALWCATQLKSIATDPSCKQAITICERYFNAPCPELLANNFDRIHTPPEVTKSLIDDCDVADSEIRIVFDIAENGYKRWRKQTETDDKVAACVHCAIRTMSEAHCREYAFGRMGGSLRKGPAMAASDNLTIGMHISARMAAGYSVAALGLAAADLFSANQYSGQYDEYDERETIAETAMETARKAQADWLKQNIKLTFD